MKSLRLSQKARNALYIGLLCSIAYLAVYFARNILSAVSPAMIEGGIANTEYLGRASSVYFITYAFGQLINGFIGDRIPAKIMIGLGLILAGITTLIFPFTAESFPNAALFVYALTGFFLSMIYAPMTKVIAENADPLYAPRCSLGYTFSSFLGSPLAGFAAAFLTWQSVFFTGSLALGIMGCAVFTAFTLFERKGIVSKSKKEISAQGSATAKEKLKILIRRDIIRFTLFSILTGIVRTTVVFWIPTYLCQKLEYTPESAALIYTCATFVIAFSTFIGVFTYERLGYNMNLTILVMFIASTLFFGLLFIAKNPIVNIIFLVLGIMAADGASAMIWARYCPGLRDTGMVSSATGFLDFVSYMSASISSTIFANSVDTIGWNGLILVWCGLMALGIVVSLFKNQPSATH